MKKKSTFNSDSKFNEKYCSVCNKYFIIIYVKNWTYKSNNDYYCCYTCYDKALTEHENSIYRRVKKYEKY